MIFVVVCEARADFRVASSLCDRVVERDVDWAAGNLDSLRAWQGIEAGETFTKWIRIRDLAQNKQIRSLGHVNGEKQSHDAAAAHKAIAVASLMDTAPDAIFLIRDSDDDADRRKGLEQARSVNRGGSAVVIGLAEPNREAWVLAGYLPTSTIEEETLGLICSQLHFDPTRHPHRLNDTKRILTQLLDPASSRFDRETACWSETDLEILQQRGISCGLSQYLEEVQSRVLPLFGVSRHK